jgi:hypothetical protein
MGILDRLFGKKEVKEPEPAPSPVSEPKPDKEKKPRKPRAKKPSKELSPKELATQNGEPYVNILKMELDPNDVNNGAFELDWNDKFVLNLIRAGYKIRKEDTEQQIVDRWFQTVCRNIALEIYEQQQADPDKRDVRVIRSRDLGDGRTEVS